MKTTTTTTQVNYKLSDWLTCKDELIHFGFTETEIEHALKDIKYALSDLTDEKGFERIPTWMKTYEIIKDGYRFKTKRYQGEWEKEIDVTGYLVRVKAQYQGLKHGKLIFQLLKNKFDWFDSFSYETIEKKMPELKSYVRLNDIPEELKNYTVDELLKMTEPIEVKVKKSRWEIYELSSKDHFEIYLKTSLGSLYVPIQSLLNKDFSLIEKRMKEYFGWYYNASGYALNHRGRSKEQYESDQKNEYNKHVAILDAPEALKLKSLLK